MWSASCRRETKSTVVEGQNHCANEGHERFVTCKLQFPSRFLADLWSQSAPAIFLLGGQRLV
jgi:hypothetical protein